MKDKDLCSIVGCLKPRGRNRRRCYMHQTRWVRHGDVHHTRPGFRMEEGRVEVYAPNHPFARPNGYVFRSRLVMEKLIGRYLTRDEIVHHKNHDRSDDRPENLQICSKAEHARIHTKPRLANGRFA